MEDTPSAPPLVPVVDASPEAALRLQLQVLTSTSNQQALEAESVLHELNNKLASAEQAVTVATTTADAIRLAHAGQVERVQELELELQRERDSQVQAVAGQAGLAKLQEEREQEKRELLQSLDAALTEKQSTSDSLVALRQLYTTLQSSQSTLEASLQETTTVSRTSLLRIQTLTSTLSSLEADKTFLNTELERSRTEAAAYRREKHAELTRVQSELDVQSLAATSTTTTLAKLKVSHQALTERHEEMMGDLNKAREELGANESTFSNEMSSMRRLVDMLEQRESDRKTRMEAVERALEDDRGDKANIEEEWRAELEKERDRSDGLERRCSELREALERSVANGPDASFDSIPSNGDFALNASAQRAARLQKTGRSYAEVYSEYVKMQDELAAERAETKRLGEILAQILADIEERAPLLKEQRLEYERLTVEATQLSSSLAHALADRDAHSRQSESFRLDLERLSLDNTIMTAQLRDLGRQLRASMRSLAASEFGGINERSGDAQADEEEEAIRKRAEESNDTDAVVSAHLVTFSTINELQIQNQKLLRITREMGAQMERAEEDALARRRGEENAAVGEAHEMILRLKDEVESQRAKTEAFVRERDMFRRMLAQRGSLTGNGDATEADGTSASRGAGMDPDAPRVLAEVQANFDAYRSEIAIDTQRLRDDLTQSQRDANAARTELAKTRAQSEFLAERFRLLNETYELQSGEVTQMSQRTVQLQRAVERHDSSSHKLTEELLQLRSTSDQLRHENTNYRTEREVWKSVESRLIEENAALSKERSHLADLMRNLQSMQNELERAGGEARRRLEESVTRLETQATDLRDKLSQEIDSTRQLSLRRDFDNKMYQDKLDKLTSDYSATREALIVAQTSQQHLEQRITDLVEQINTKEEKLAIYEGRGNAAIEADSSMSPEQQLQVEIAGLRTDLRAAQSKLGQAAANVEQYQSISLTQGESLSELQATYDEFKLTTDRTLVEKEAEISSLRERLHILTTDLTAASTENSELHRQVEEGKTAFEKERKVLEDEIAGVKASDQRAQTAQLAAQLDLRRQAQFARNANDKYERELLAHAEDVKRLTGLKDDLKTVRARTSELATAAEVAQANLLGSESSWARQKTALEQEISDLKKRCDDLNGQNAVLHEHLETFGTQATQLQTLRTAPAPADGSAPDTIAEEAVVANATSSTEQLREVIRYLRREKDIVDLQLEFSKQEATRLRQQLAFAARNLEESRQALVEERAKTGDSAVSSAQHAELLERIHTANLLRESNSTLRSENEANMRKVAALDGRLREALNQLTPLQEQVQTLLAEVESKEHHLKLLEEDNERWKNRNQQILSKYERIDPEELQVLKDEITKISGLLAEMQQERDAALVRVAEEAKLAESMKSNWHVSQERFKSLQVQARAARTEKDTLAKEVIELKEKMESAAVAPLLATPSAVDLEAQAEKDRATQAERDILSARASKLEEEKAALEAQLRQELDERTTRLASLEAQNNQLLAEKATLAAEKAKADSDVARLLKREKPIFDDNKRLVREAKERSDDLGNLRKQFEEDNAAAIETVVAARLATAVPPATLSDAAIAESVRTQVAAAEVKFTEERAAAIATAVATATTQLQVDIQALRSQLASTSSTPASTESADQALTLAKDKLLAEFEMVKAELGAAAKAREDEITVRLTQEISQLREAANVDPTAAAANPVDIDALVAAKLAQLETTRLAEQQALIATAVATALAARSTEHQAELAKTKAQAENEALAKNKVLMMQLTKQKSLLAAATAKLGGAAPPAAARPPPTPTLSAPSPSSPLPPLVATADQSLNSRVAGGMIRGAATPRGGVPARGRQVRGGGRGGAVALNPLAAPVAAPSVVASIRGSAPSIALRGAATSRGGGVLGHLVAANAAANAAVPSASPKRSRDGEDATDPAKRTKQGDATP